ncbi:MAG TPA: CBS domain-containing protein [Candidatus Angelobacter sp.]|jgi:CBS domain-containing protein|nr:CBS domain-containing protein [Candidatus Angelobacter sp.]
MKVQEIMSERPACCIREDFVQVAASIMNRLDTGIVPVTESAHQHSALVGVVTDRDLCLRILAADRDPNTTRINDVMSPEVTVCKTTDTVETALAHMRHSKVRRLPVVNNDLEVVGMISLGDVIRQKAVTEAELLKTMAAISAPVKRARVKAMAA